MTSKYTKLSEPIRVLRIRN